MKVLVTGGGGFLGQAICKQLVAAGYTVCAFNRNRHPALDDLNVEQRIGDIGNLDSVVEAAKGVDAIVHSAGKVGAWGRLEDYYETNVRGTDNVLAACELHEIRKLVFTSSGTVVHSGGDLEGLNESAPYASHFSSPYAQTKALAEQRVLAANGKDLATVALRPHVIWGAGDPHFLPRILKQARSGRLRLIGKIAKKTDTTYIDNAALAHVLALQKLDIGAPIAGRKYFISQGEPITHEALINGWLRADGFPPETRRMPLGMAEFLGSAFETIYQTLRIQREPPLTRFVVEQLSTSHWFNIDAARNDLGYAPTVTIAEGMARLSQFLARERMSRRG
ncbi:MAG TPA: NAD-dependent epimerase/dehydratase family protein [Rudaea sp.]|jgi:nucleoside-diphosphate-sugar epimerase|nr:NAD-dependent epimerase/dehydratase family protein [Rudaea sp.]